MSERPRLLVPALMSVLVLAALAFAILATKSTSSQIAGRNGSGGADGAGAASGTAVSAAAGQFDGAGLPAGVVAPPFTLTSQEGHRVSLSSLRGKPVVLAFLYSTCGAPCVLIAQQLRGALDEVGDGTVHVVIVSADPRADTPASVRAFLAQVSLRGRVAYLSGAPKQLEAVWKAYRVKPASAGRTLFRQYATVLLIDPRGQERVLYGQEQLTPESLAHDIGRVK
jgi:protein SCO1/2